MDEKEFQEKFFWCSSERERQNLLEKYLPEYSPNEFITKVNDYSTTTLIYNIKASTARILNVADENK